MSEGFRNYEGQNTIRPLIPQTTSFNQLPVFQGMHSHATINSLFDHYVRLIRENNILTNQLKLINT